jgi:hypothetical protein
VIEFKYDDSPVETGGTLLWRRAELSEKVLVLTLSLSSVQSKPVPDYRCKPHHCKSFADVSKLYPYLVLSVN